MRRRHLLVLSAGALAAPALITRLSAPHDRPLAFAWWGCFMPFGMALAMLAAPALTTIGWRGLWLVMAALPTASNAFVLAKQFDQQVEQNSASVLLSTAFSVVTLSALLVYLRVS